MTAIYNDHENFPTKHFKRFNLSVDLSLSEIPISSNIALFFNVKDFLFNAQKFFLGVGK